MEILLCINGWSNPTDPILDSKLTKSGDVIACQPDGWGWGIEEINNPNWRIIRIAGLSQAIADSLLAPELPIDINNPSPVLQLHGMIVNLMGLEQLSPGIVSNPRAAFAKLDPNAPETPQIIGAAVAALPIIQNSSFTPLVSLKPVLPIPNQIVGS